MDFSPSGLPLPAGYQLSDIDLWKQLSVADLPPMSKAGCRMIAYQDRELVLFGGYGFPKLSQPGAEFIEDTWCSDDGGWTNELHTFDLENGEE